jgi:hypothetical protein
VTFWLQHRSLLFDFFTPTPAAPAFFVINQVHANVYSGVGKTIGLLGWNIEIGEVKVLEQ